MKKLLAILLTAAMLVMVGGCGNTDSGNNGSGTANPPADSGNTGSDAGQPAPGFDTTKDISVISREEGSGTRGAFIELFGVEQKDAEGNKQDMTTEGASITNNTNVMLSTVVGNPYAIGYVSLGSLNDTVKALKIDGAEATVANIKDGTYKIARPFNICTVGKVSEVAQDFIKFIMSKDGQAVIEDNGYISAAENEAYTAAGLEGKIVVAGSSSVTPVMEKLKEAYVALNDKVEIEVQMSDSSTGVNSAIDGSCDIGMASRELKDSEIEKGAEPTVIAQDGIAVIVNLENTTDGLTKDQVMNIYTGQVTTWDGATK
ncbi:MAG: substrate-binding domain-containing protein [Peptococcaceae bacterium]|nr:substrate-binding domain-containing protein [Peptococcaceae bacterium]